MRRSEFILGLSVILVSLELGQSNRCLTMMPEVNPKRVVHLNGQSLTIPFEMTQRTSQRLATRVMKIFLVEVLGYPGISLLERDDIFDSHTVFARMSDSNPYSGSISIPETMVNMEVWIPPQEDVLPLANRYDVKECGSLTPPGSFGWFVPVNLSTPDDNWRTFLRPETSSRFDITGENWEKLKNWTIDPTTGKHFCESEFCREGMYIPEMCRDDDEDRKSEVRRGEKLEYRKKKKCAVLLAGVPEYTDFVRDHIEELKLYVKVVWVGPNLKKIVNDLKMDLEKEKSGSLVLIHWRPSSVIPVEEEFINLEFPKCGSRYSELGCKYESNRLVKLAWSKLEAFANLAFRAISRAHFEPEHYEDLLKRYNDEMSKSEQVDEEKVACSWIRDNVRFILEEWSPRNEDKNTLIIGGIFPMSGTSYRASSIVLATKMAKIAINSNNTILRDYNLTLSASDGQCKSEMVMKAFIDYIAHNYYKKLIGVLGPACSETVEPLVGVSKHYRTVIISYSAEGSSFNDRTRYPYFFRTIGENKHYRHLYLKLFQTFHWKRVAALTEDGQKYTEYISYMQEILRDNDIHFVANIKFPRERGTDEMSKYLQELKEKRARIIIADVYDVAARQVMCEAYKLEMTAVQGYVWFLPLWLRSGWHETDFYNSQGEDVPCTSVEMSQAINGHFGITYAYFAADDEIMQEGITVKEWRSKYEKDCEDNGQIPSNYAGYAYDAMWTYAYAVDALLKENQSYVFDLHSDHTVNRLTDLIAATDFNGVSGKIKFFGGASRFSVITIVQRIDNETRTIGNFYPNVSEERKDVIGGHLDLNKSAILWLSGSIPDDGSEPPVRCVLAGLAELMDVSCEVAIVIANIIGFGLLGVILIIGFICIKKKYEDKVRQHEKVMESFGLDPRQTTSGLDKWEIPRDRVVINRKLGEGAFGTVYGGEAFFPEKGWLAVAVKTLKAGSSTDEKLDFLSEVEVMKRFEHKNIIKLLGVCIKCAPVLTVMEFMLYGDLKTYLLARRHLVNDQSYEDSDEISNKKLTAMALDVARALSYLAQLKYVHRDVASRNCLVNAARIVKLGDFGMTRPMYENDYYKFNRKGMLPVRWMAPESLGLGIFTPASDVWSYGVLLYEIITFGSFPFQGMSNNEVLAYVKAGNSLEVPKGVKPQLEGLIRSCWAVEHTSRPTAPEIVDFLATNTRVVCPCLDVPLASVQMENTGQMDFQIAESIRKFSMSLSWPPSQTRRTNISPLSGLTPLTNEEQLVDIETPKDDEKWPTTEVNGNNVDAILTVRNSNEQDVSLPLLPDDNRIFPRYIKLNSNLTSRNPQSRYVNLQPGKLTSNDDQNEDTKEREHTSTEEDSFL